MSGVGGGGSGTGIIQEITFNWNGDNDLSSCIAVLVRTKLLALALVESSCLFY